MFNICPYCSKSIIGEIHECGNLNQITVAAEPTPELVLDIDKLYKAGIELIRKKNRDYAGLLNPWKNFETVLRLGIPVQKGIFVRFLDKVTRLENLLFNVDTTQPFVTEESVDDTILDAINYLGLLYARRQMELRQTGQQLGIKTKADLLNEQINLANQ